MATRVFGPGVEPGGMDLDDNHDEVQCPACKGKAIARYWEACEGGAINAYNNIHCTVCGHFEGDTGEGDEYDHLFESCHDEDFAALRAEIEAVNDSPDVENLVRHDLAFHRGIVECSGNAYLAGLIESLSNHTVRARVWRGLTQADAVERTLAEHTAILDALESGDAELAAALTTVHISGVEKWLRDASQLP